jgi:uncharacterized protein (DUF1800 family)
MTIREIQHLYWRAGFGILPQDIEALKGKSREDVVSRLFLESKKVTPLQIDISEVEIELEKALISKNEVVFNTLRKKSRKLLKDYNIAWINRLSAPSEVLRERMTLFWANHFVVRDNRIDFVQDYNNMLRGFALGDFRSFVKQMSKQAAMLKYLNNKQNIKRSPNENFARELMELFTLGEGHYSEQDIKESARAFTGYSHDIKGDFFLRQRQHDYGEKTFLDCNGDFDGDDIIDVILEQRQCARFISEKIYKYFVNETINDAHVEAMTNVFYKDYSIEKLMQFVFLSDWFYDEVNVGSKIKSPIDFYIGMQNIIPLKFEDDKSLFFIQKSLGQTLLNPPNVAGWRGGKQWVDSNTILMRLRLASVLYNNAHIPKNKKGDFGDPLGQFFERSKKHNLLRTTVNWDKFNQNFNAVSTNDLHEFLIASKINKGTLSFLETLSKSSKKDYCIQLMSIPEYQMC